MLLSSLNNSPHYLQSISSHKVLKSFFLFSRDLACLDQTKHIGMKRIGMKPIATKPIDIKGIGYKTYRNYRYRYIKHIAGLNISFTKPIGTKPIAI